MSNIVKKGFLPLGASAHAPITKPASTDATQLGVRLREESGKDSISHGPAPKIRKVAETMPLRMEPHHSGTTPLQIFGALPGKTVYTAADAHALRREFCFFGQPLILFRSVAAEKSQYFLGREVIERLEDRSMSPLDLRKLDVIFSYRKLDADLVLPSGNLATVYDNINLSYCLLGFNLPPSQASELAGNIYVTAALASNHLLPPLDQKVALQWIEKIPKNVRQEALDAALFSAIHANNVTLCETLLSWGANPNGLREDDELTALGVAIRHDHKEVVQLLLKRGADPKLDAGSDIPALDLIKNPRFTHLMPVFAEFVRASEGS